MPKRSKKNIGRVIDGKAGLKTTGAGRNGRRSGVIIAAVTITLILIVAATFYYQTQVAPFKQPVLTVDNTVIDMSYYLRKAKLTSGDPAAVLEQLVDEQLVKLMAPTFGIAVTPAEIDSQLLYTASTGNTTGNISGNSTDRYLTESEFNTWYHQRLNDSGLSDAEYKEMTRTNMLAAKLQEYLAQRVPTIAQQVHLNAIVLANSTNATQAKARITAGESFADIAREVSLDTQTRDQGGDIGWLPRGVLPYDNTIFALGVGAVSNPVAVNPATPATSQYLLFMVSEKAATREIDDGTMQVLRSRAFSSWLTREMPSHNIVVNYDFNKPENQAWITWQLTKLSQ